MGITNPGEPYFKNGGWGWNGSEWVKLGVVWGYSAVYQESAVNNDAAAGTNYLSGAVVPAGEVWVLTNIIVWDLATANSYINLMLHDGVNVHVIHRKKGPTADVAEEWSGHVYLQAGDKLYCGFYGCALHDVLSMTGFGYKMKVA